MADRPIFLYAAIYDDIDAAEADYEAVFDLHAVGAIGTFDSAVIRKEEDGKVRVTKTEKPTQHGAWTGAGVGALVGILFPPAILGAAIVGAGAGGLTGHLSGGISRGDLKELGDELQAGTAAVIVFGESRIEEQLEKALTRANKLIEKQVNADADELEREIDAAAKRAPRALSPSAVGLRCHQASTAYSCHVSGTPFSVWLPRSENWVPDPATRSFTVRDTSSSWGSA